MWWTLAAAGGWGLELLLVVFELVMLQEMANRRWWPKYSGLYYLLIEDPENVQGVGRAQMEGVDTANYSAALGALVEELESLLGRF